MNSRIRRAAVGFGLASILAAPCAAQDPGPLAPGVRVRVSVGASRDRLKGTVQALDDRTLSVIGDDRALVKIERRNITRLETGWGRRGNARRGLLIGGLAGVGLAGVGVGLLVCGADGSGWALESERRHTSSCHGEEWVDLPLAAAAVYGGIGALIGHLIKSDRWVEVPVRSAQLSLGPLPRGLGAAVSLRF